MRQRGDAGGSPRACASSACRPGGRTVAAPPARGAVAEGHMREMAAVDRGRRRGSAFVRGLRRSLAIRGLPGALGVRPLSRWEFGRARPNSGKSGPLPLNFADLRGRWLTAGNRAAGPRAMRPSPQSAAFRLPTSPRLSRNVMVNRQLTMMKKSLRPWFLSHCQDDRMNCRVKALGRCPRLRVLRLTCVRRLRAGSR